MYPRLSAARPDYLRPCAAVTVLEENYVDGETAIARSCGRSRSGSFAPEQQIGHPAAAVRGHLERVRRMPALGAADDSVRSFVRIALSSSERG